MNNTVNYYRGDIYFANLGDYNGSIQGGERPVMIIQNDIGNKFSPTVIVATISSQIHKAKLPTHVIIDNTKCGLYRESFVMLEQVKTINKSDLISYVGRITDIKEILKINRAISLSMDIEKDIQSKKNIEIAKEKLEKIKGIDLALNKAEEDDEIKKTDFYNYLLNERKNLAIDLKEFCMNNKVSLEINEERRIA